MANLTSARFAGDSTLGQVLNGTLRLGAVGTSPIPAPVLSSGPAITKVQRALIDIGFDMPTYGPDGSFGAETGNAVALFKKDWHLSPADPVVGPGTIDALDREMRALERTTPVPPPAPPPPVVADPYGRTASGAARLPAALATAALLGGTGTGSPWLKLDRATIAADITRCASFPDSAQQGGNGLCTTAAFINVWAQDAPDAYAAFASALYNSGSAQLASSQFAAGQLIKASSQLMAADYGSIKTRMASRGFPVPSQADWMVMSAIRDSTNRIVAFTGDPDDWVSSVLGDGASSADDLTGWLQSAGAWSSVAASTTSFFSPSLASALSLNPLTSRCILNIDVSMINSDVGRHSVVLRSPISLTAGGLIVEFKIWTWAGVRQISVPKPRFVNNYYGAHVAVI